MRHLLAVAVLLPQLAWAGTLDRIAAVVNDEIITLTDIYEIGEPFVRQRCPGLSSTSCVNAAELEVLESLILQTLAGQDLEARGMGVTSEDVDRAVDQVVRDYGAADREDLKRQVEAQGLPWATWRDQIQLQLRQMKFNETIIRPRVTVTEDEIVDAYNRVKKQFTSDAKRVVHAIGRTVPLGLDEAGREAFLAETAAIAAKINNGELTFQAALEEYDGGTYLAADPPGLMGEYTEGSLFPALDDAVWGAEVGNVVGPVALGETTLMLIQVVAVQDAGAKPLAEVRAEISEQLFQQKTAAEVEEWYQTARRQAAVKVLLDGAEAAPR